MNYAGKELSIDENKKWISGISAYCSTEISLILSALLIGSSLAIISDKGPKLFDVSILGLIGFVFSAALGIYLVIQFMLKEK